MVLPPTTWGARTWMEWPSAGVAGPLACPATGAIPPARIPSAATLKTIRVIPASPRVIAWPRQPPDQGEYPVAPPGRQGVHYRDDFPATHPDSSGGAGVRSARPDSPGF